MIELAYSLSVGLKGRGSPARGASPGDRDRPPPLFRRPEGPRDEAKPSPASLPGAFRW